MRIAIDAGPRKIAFVKAGQHGDRDDFCVFPRRSLGILHHRAPAAGVDGDNGWFEHMDRLHRAGDRIGNVMQLEVEERSEEHTSELQSLMRISYAVFCLKKKIN